jgi:hypothetical protein
MNTTINLLTAFVNQRPGLDFCNYGDIKAYRQESREITADKHDFFELLGFAARIIENLEEKVKTELENTNGRLQLKDGKLEYCTGQYFPTEYRPAASRILVSVIWNELRNTYETGDQIRKAAKRNLSRRATKNYFR